MPAYPSITYVDREEEVTLGYENGERVFVTTSKKVPAQNEGMSKLEAFTMAAMQGLVNGLVVAGGITGHGWQHEEIAAEAVRISKATLSELSKQQQG